MWRNPLALLALGSIAAPILIHILVQRRAERFPFPTLRFIAPTRLAAIRRHLLEDAALLAVRIAILTVAIIALAGPLLVTAARRRAWDQQVVRAVVFDERNNPPPDPALIALGGNGSGVIHILGRSPGVVEQKAFDADVLRDGIRRAVAWLDTAAPGRRELVVRSPLPIGSLTDADIAEVPAGIGIRFDRQGILPATRTVTGGTVLTADGSRRQNVTLDGARTLVAETPVTPVTDWPIEISAPASDRPVLDAAIAAVRSERVWAPSTDRRARLVVVNPAGTTSSALAASSAIQQPWMAEAVFRIARDKDLQAAAAAVPVGSTDVRLTSAPWQTLASAVDGRPLVLAAASGAQLIVASAADPKELITAVLVRTVANGLAEPADLQQAEVTPILEPVLHGWSRDAGPAPPPRIDTIADDDRRWFWLAALALLALETWMRRPRTAAVSQVQEESRVA